MKQEINPKDTNRAIAFELWMKSPMPMVTLTKTFDVTRLCKVSRRRGMKFNMLLCLAIDYAQRELGAQKITLGVFFDNLSAVECYKSVGFRITGADAYQIDGEVWKGFEMELELEEK